MASEMMLYTSKKRNNFLRFNMLILDIILIKVADCFYGNDKREVQI